MTAGEICIARTYEHPCVTPSNLTFYCPESNIYEREPIWEYGNNSIKCRICGMLDVQPMDTSPVDGHLTTTISFGPNALEGSVDENIVVGYAIYFADNCSRKLGKSLAYVVAKGYGLQPCCQYDAYTVDLDVDYPENVTNVSLMIVPNTLVGELSVGFVTEQIEDYWVNGTVRVARTSSAHRVAPIFARIQLFRWLAPLPGMALVLSCLTPLALSVVAA